MVIKIEYMDDTTIELKSVQTITLIGQGPYLLHGSTFDINVLRKRICPPSPREKLRYPRLVSRLDVDRLPRV